MSKDDQHHFWNWVAEPEKSIVKVRGTLLKLPWGKKRGPQMGSKVYSQYKFLILKPFFCLIDLILKLKNVDTKRGQNAYDKRQTRY